MKQSAKLKFFTASSGYESARIIYDDETVRHIHSTVHPEDEFNYHNNLSIWGECLILAGYGLGYHIEPLLRDCTASLIICIDYFPEFTEKAMQHLGENFPNTLYINNKTSPKHIYKILSNVLNKKNQIIRHQTSFASFPDWYNLILNNIPKQQNSSNVHFCKPLLLHASHFLQKEISSALKQIFNCETLHFIYNNIATGSEYENKLQKTITQHNVDCIISVNMTGFDGNGFLAETAKRLGIPIIIWYVDDPRPILLNHSHSINNTITAFCWEKSYIPWLKSLPFDAIHYLPLASDPDIFLQPPQDNHTTALGFVGSSMGGEFLTTLKSRFLYNQSLEPIIQMCASELIKSPKLDILNMIKEKYDLEIFSDLRNKTWLVSYIIHTASMKKRAHIIKAIALNQPEIFGDQYGWNVLLGKGFTIHPNCDYYNSLANIYNDTAISLNITSCQMQSAINQRVFDAPLAGSFCLTDNQKDITDFFIPDIEIVTYESTTELKEKLNYYTNHAQIRTDIMLAGRKRILKEHTYLHRCKKMFSLLNS